MSDNIIEGVSGAKYREFHVPIFVGYWNMSGVGRLPAEVKPSLWRRFTHKLFFGWTWHDGLDGL